jgi:hypothetical protein
MSIIFADDFTAVDFDNIDIIEPVKDLEDNIVGVGIRTKSCNTLRLSFEQYGAFVKNCVDTMEKAMKEV